MTNSKPNEMREQSGQGRAADNLFRVFVDMINAGVFKEGER